jgi:cbb3-type cytochrome oxidase maturation protein
MIIIVLLLSVSLLVAVCFLVAYIWGVKSGQFEDDYSPAHRIFYEEELIDNK